MGHFRYFKFNSSFAHYPIMWFFHQLFEPDGTFPDGWQFWLFFLLFNLSLFVKKQNCWSYSPKKCLGNKNRVLAECFMSSNWCHQGWNTKLRQEARNERRLNAIFYSAWTRRAPTLRFFSLHLQAAVIQRLVRPWAPVSSLWARRGSVTCSAAGGL